MQDLSDVLEAQEVMSRMSGCTERAGFAKLERLTTAARDLCLHAETDEHISVVDSHDLKQIKAALEASDE